MALYLGKKRVCPSNQVQVPSMKAFFDAGGKCSHSTATSFEGIIKYGDTSNVTDMDSMFYQCVNLTTIPQLDTSNVTNMNNMFYVCLRITAIPQLDTSKVYYMCYMFGSCRMLTTIPSLDVSNANTLEYMFDSCPNLTEIHMYGMKASFSISASTKFTEEALVEVLKNLATVTTTKTLRMGSTNLAKLSDEEKAIATNKGWTLA